MTQLQIVYPVLLTDRDWQKKKGVANKATKTGVGARKTVAASAKQLAPKFAAAENTINTTIPVFAKHNDQTVRKHLESMRAALTALRDRLEDDVADELERALRADYKTRLSTAREVGVAIASGEKARTTGKALLDQIKTVEADPRIATVKRTWGGNKGLANRDLSTACKYWTQIAVKAFPQSTKRLYPGDPLQSVLTAQWVSDVGDEDGGTASTRLKAMVSRDADGDMIDEDELVVQFCRDYRKSVIDAAPFIRAVDKLGATLKGYVD